ncbi:hypothetical protein HMPREF9120_02677 [Neisseria sp. oral taxon 020 str. F0370]|nr:hypothetical protein HMPREF9120_02677 [Neisseria sp. oral taxon 020 str. F0370]
MGNSLRVGWGFRLLLGRADRQPESGIGMVSDGLPVRGRLKRPSERRNVFSDGLNLPKLPGRLQTGAGIMRFSLRNARCAAALPIS